MPYSREHLGCSSTLQVRREAGDRSDPRKQSGDLRDLRKKLYFQLTWQVEG